MHILVHYSAEHNSYMQHAGVVDPMFRIEFIYWEFDEEHGAQCESCNNSNL